VPSLAARHTFLSATQKSMQNLLARAIACAQAGKKVTAVENELKMIVEC
jgi:hypothetical protein